MDLEGNPGATVEGAVEAAQTVADREEQEPVPLNTRKPIRLPSELDQLKHRKTHIPFMPWCPECVAGRKPNWGHYSISPTDREIIHPEVHLDYCFFRSRPGGCPPQFW